MLGADGILELRDLQSTGGTFIVRGGKEIPVSRSPLKKTDTLRFGEYDISVADLLILIPDERPEPKPAVIRPPARAPEAPAPRLRMVRCACGSIKERGKLCPDCGA
jgi:pSer/pThr/pTyr-binding forkhead associated (FHA) protein